MERIGIELVAGLQPTQIVEATKYAESLGYYSAWMAEGHGGDQFSILTACAIATERILLGTGITVLYVRSAPTIAMAAASVDEFSNGRFILGLASGHREMVEDEHGLKYKAPMQHIKEYLNIIRTLIKKGNVQHAGEVINIQNFDLWFKPFRPNIPIYLGAVNPKMLRLCGEIADGVMLTHITEDKAREAVSLIAEGARSVGRRPEDVDVSALWGCSVSDDRSAARNRYRDYLALYPIRLSRYRKLMADAGFGPQIEAAVFESDQGNIQKAKDMMPDEMIDQLGIVGTPQDVRDRINAYRDIGISHPILSPLVDEGKAMDQTIYTIRACAPG